MRYHVLHIKTAFPEEWRKAVFDQMLCNIGVDTIDGDDYYLPSEIWEQKEKLIRATIGVEYAMDQSAQLLSVEACPDENWNAAWEADHPEQQLPLGIRIVPHCAFGAGHHETTSMMIDALLESEITNLTSNPLTPKPYSVLDHGTGTGVLAIFAKRLGATRVVAVDIDEKSVINARENAALNSEDIEVLLSNSISGLTATRSDSEAVQQCNGLSSFNLILANIHRNILLHYMPDYAASLVDGGQLWLSGFYTADAPALIDAAEAHGLHLLDTRSTNDWCLLRLQKSS